MSLSGPSVTAARTATHRAQHQLLDTPRVFDDPFAIRLLGDAAIESLDDPPPQAMLGRIGMRLFLATRARYAEDRLAEAYARGTRRCIVLGAGLDTFALRNPFPDLEVIEVDHPKTQAWKRERYEAAGIALPACLRFVAVDFTKDDLSSALANVGAGAFVSWLGVSYYLPPAALDTTLAALSALGPGTELVVDYAQHPELLDEPSRRYFAVVRERVAAAGEPFVSLFSPEELAVLLSSHGFTVLEDLAYAPVYERLTGASPPTPKGFGAMAHART